MRLHDRVVALTPGHPSYGYRQVTALLRAEGWRVNRERVHHVWREEGRRDVIGTEDDIDEDEATPRGSRPARV